MNIEIITLIVFGAAALLFGVLYMNLRGEAARLRALSDEAMTTLNSSEQARVTTEALHREAEVRLQTAQKEILGLRDRKSELETTLAALKASSEAEIETLRRRIEEDRTLQAAEREKQEEHFRLQFKDLANEILGEQTKHFKQTSSESIDLLLKPFRDNITDFRKRVEEIYTTQTSQRGELKAELKNLMELNQRITSETTNLTNALKGNSKVQGDWGEMLLETILDNSSLIKGIHYDTQYNIKDEEGRDLRPDVVLHLPEKKHIIIDSKVSLTAFVGYTSAESATERDQYLAAHITSVRKHVTELSRKEYQLLLKSPDFVIMFIPNEPAFLAALQHDPSIWTDAYEKKIIVSSPTNLFALLKMVADMWKYNDQDKNTQEIAKCALKLYDQSVALTASFESVGAALEKAHTAYDDVHKRLCTGNDNIVRVGERLKKIARLQSKKRHSTSLIEADDNMADESVVPTPELTAAESGEDVRSQGEE